MQQHTAESKRLGYNVARGTIEDLENPNLLSWLKEKKVDVFKLSIPSPPTNLYSLLDGLGLRYYVLGITVEYKAVFNKYTLPEYLNKGISFKEYRSGDSFDFKTFAKNIFHNASSSFFLNPGLKKYYNEEKQAENFASYIETLNSENNSTYYTHICLLGNKPVGFITSFKKGSGGGVLYAGILREYEAKGIFLDIIRFIHIYGREIGQKWGLASAQLHNTVVQKSYQKFGMKSNGYTMNVHINSFFGLLKD